MTAKKTTTLNLRIDPKLKAALKEAAVLDHRSIANMVEVLILRHCKSILNTESSSPVITEGKNS